MEREKGAVLHTDIAYLFQKKFCQPQSKCLYVYWNVWIFSKTELSHGSPFYSVSIFLQRKQFQTPNPSDPWYKLHCYAKG